MLETVKIQYIGENAYIINADRTNLRLAINYIPEGSLNICGLPPEELSLIKYIITEKSKLRELKENKYTVIYGVEGENNSKKEKLEGLYSNKYALIVEEILNIDKDTSIAFISPPKLDPEEKDLNLLILVSGIQILYITRPTFLRDPPLVDVLIIPSKTLERLVSLANREITRLPFYAGARSELLVTDYNLALGEYYRNIEESYILQRCEAIYIIRHLTKINVIKRTKIFSG